MVELPHALHQRLAFWLELMPEASFPLYLVGGTVRDILLDRNVQDIDFVLLGAKKLFNLLRKKDSLAAVVMGKNKPKTCYRLIDRKNTNNFIDLCEIEGPSIEDDLACRDFTLNAIALQLSRNAEIIRIIDPFDGTGHIREGKIVSLGHHSFREDPLRLLRAFRFSATLGFRIDEGTLSVISEHQALLSNISVERVRSELFKLLDTSNSIDIIREMDKTGILEQIFPEIVPMRGCEQNMYHHLDVWNHSLLTMENCERIINNLEQFYPSSANEIKSLLSDGQKNLLLKLATLLHDVAKPSSRVMKETGRITFYGHEEAGEAMIRKMGKRLKFSNKDIDFLALVVREHLHVKVLQNDEVRQNTFMRWFQKYGDDTAAVTIMGMADTLSKNSRVVTDEVVETYRIRSGEKLERYFKGYKQAFVLKPLVTGKDLIELGMKPGKDFKAILKTIRNAQLNGEISTREEALQRVQSS